MATVAWSELCIATKLSAQSLWGKAGTSHLCDGSAHSPGCVVNGYDCLLGRLS